jgi:hypothetical protein
MPPTWWHFSESLPGLRIETWGTRRMKIPILIRSKNSAENAYSLSGGNCSSRRFQVFWLRR